MVKLTDGEKLIILMLADLSKKMKIDSDFDPKFISEAIYGDHLWGLAWQYPGIFGGEEPSDPVVSEVCDILDVWSFIESGYVRLSAGDKKRVAETATPFGDSPKFHGFDGNNESRHYSTALFLIDDLGRFGSLRGRDLNSHSPKVDAYRRMIEEFKPIRPSLVDRTLSADEIIALLQALIHPSMR